MRDFFLICSFILTMKILPTLGKLDQSIIQQLYFHIKYRTLGNSYIYREYKIQLAKKVKRNMKSCFDNSRVIVFLLSLKDIFSFAVYIQIFFQQ